MMSDTGRYRITLHPVDAGETLTLDIAATSAARALRILAAKLENPEWRGPSWSYAADIDWYRHKP